MAVCLRRLLICIDREGFVRQNDSALGRKKVANQNHLHNCRIPPLFFCVLLLMQYIKGGYMELTDEKSWYAF